MQVTVPAGSSMEVFLLSGCPLYCFDKNRTVATPRRFCVATTGHGASIEGA